MRLLRETLEGDHMLIQRCDDGWIASYRFSPMAGTSGKMATVRDAIEWLTRIGAIDWVRRIDRAERVKP